MRYTKAVYLMNKEKILVTEEDAKKIREAVMRNPQGFVQIEGQLVNKSTITMIGDHSSTSHLKNLDKSQADVEMNVLGMGELVEKKRNDIMQKSIENALKEKSVMIGKEYEDFIKTEVKEIENRPQTSEEVMNGDVAYYIDKATGEKMYS